MVCHSPQQFRVFCLPSSNAEDEDRVFNFLKTVSTLTSNHHPDNVLANAFVRMQVRQENNDEILLTKRRRRNGHSAITKSGRKLPPKRNTLIPIGIINTYPFAWQAHCERIADFLAVPGSWKETSGGVEFFDTKTIDVEMGHFRHTTIKKEVERVKSIWDEIVVTKNHLIPCNVIIDDNGHKTNIDSLQYKKKKRKNLIYNLTKGV